MVTTRKVTGTAKRFPIGILIGAGSSVLITFAAALIIAFSVLHWQMPEAMIGYAAILTLAVASALGAWIAAVKIKRRWMLACLCSSGLYLVALLACTSVLFGGQFQGVAMDIIAVVGGATMVGVLGLTKRESGNQKVRKFRSG